MRSLSAASSRSGRASAAAVRRVKTTITPSAATRIVIRIATWVAVLTPKSDSGAYETIHRPTGASMSIARHEASHVVPCTVKRTSDVLSLPACHCS